MAWRNTGLFVLALLAFATATDLEHSISRRLRGKEHQGRQGRAHRAWNKAFEWQSIGLETEYAQFTIRCRNAGGQDLHLWDGAVVSSSPNLNFGPNLPGLKATADLIQNWPAPGGGAAPAVWGAMGVGGRSEATLELITGADSMAGGSPDSAFRQEFAFADFALAIMEVGVAAGAGGCVTPNWCNLADVITLFNAKMTVRENRVLPGTNHQSYGAEYASFQQTVVVGGAAPVGGFAPGAPAGSVWQFQCGINGCGAPGMSTQINFGLPLPALDKAVFRNSITNAAGVGSYYGQKDRLGIVQDAVQGFLAAQLNDHKDDESLRGVLELFVWQSWVQCIAAPQGAVIQKNAFGILPKARLSEVIAQVNVDAKKDGLIALQQLLAGAGAANVINALITAVRGQEAAKTPGVVPNLDRNVLAGGACFPAVITACMDTEFNAAVTAAPALVPGVPPIAAAAFVGAWGGAAPAPNVIMAQCDLMAGPTRVLPVRPIPGSGGTREVGLVAEARAPTTLRAQFEPGAGSIPTFTAATSRWNYVLRVPADANNAHVVAKIRDYDTKIAQKTDAQYFQGLNIVLLTAHDRVKDPSAGITAIAGFA